MMHWMRVGIVIGLASASAAWAADGAKTEAQRPTVAVLYFDYPGDDPELKVLSKGLASMLITDMGAQEGFDVVEREKIQAIIEELELSRTELMDPSKALQIGKIVGAQRMVTGTYWELLGKMRIDTRMFDVETAVQVCTAGVTDVRDNFFTMEADLADKLSVAMLSDGENCKEPRAGAPTPVPTRERRPVKKIDVGVAADYSRALDAIDGGKDQQAKEILTEIVGLEPGFTLAKDELEGLLK